MLRHGPRLRRAALSFAVVLAGCGAQLPTPSVREAQRCRSANRTDARKLELSDRLPPPRIVAKRGVGVEVVSDYPGNEMTFPVPRPLDAVCQISHARSKNGTAVVYFRLLRRGTVAFASTFARATDTDMPTLGGRVMVVAQRKMS
jgi:hypothetical protein